MSKALKKLIDINGLREFKNKLVGAGSAYVQTTAVDQTIAGTKTFSKPIVGSVTGNSATATKLQTARTINGTSFNGTANITTANWGTARNITITDGTNTSTAVSVNGSANVALTLPATIKANLTGNATTATTATTAKACTGNSATATKATQDSAGQQINTTYIKGLAVSGRTITYTKGDGSTGTITTQDTNTWTAFKGATSSANGTAGYVPAPTKGNQDKFFKADGTWATPPNTTYASMSASEATTGTATAARTISAKVLHDKINSNLSAYATKTELNNGLTTKANNSEVVHKSGNETIAGIKTFSDGVLSTAVNAFMAQHGGYTLVIRNDGNDTYLLMSDKNGAPGTWSNARPLVISNSTGVCNINGNAATATKATQDAAGNTITTTYATKAENNTKANNSEVVHKNGDETIAGTKTFSSNIVGNVTGNASTATNATYANWLRTSSHSDHLFHTEWDNAGYFWTYVTAGDGGYRAVRVARSDSAATAEACTGNSATATKLAAKRTIALSGAATGTATTFDGSGNITIPVTALSPSAIRAQWYAAYPDGPEAHNAMWGGRNITAAFNNGTVSANIANGTFRDIFPGDYITKSVTISGNTYTVNWVIADCDYWINKGIPHMTTHHVAIVPQAPIFNARMNPANTTEGGYAGSEMYKKIIPACATGIVNAFGSDHILTFRDAITNSVDTSHISSGIPQFVGTPGWFGETVSVQCNLMSEKMVYGAPICAAGAMDNTMATRQMSAFRLSERLINYNQSSWWLRDVVSSVFFADVHGVGYADAYYASDSRGVRPFALLK